MITLLIIGAFQSFFFAVLLLVKKKRTLCDTVLAMWLLLLFMHLLIIYCKYLGLFEEYPHLIGVTASFIFLYGPMLFFYVDNYISNFPGFKKSYFFHLIPFLLFNIYKIPFYSLGAAEKFNAISQASNAINSLDILFDFAKIISIPFYVIMILFLLKKHRNNLKFYFSNFEKKDLDWVKYLTYSIALMGVVIIFTGLAQLGDNTVLTQDSEKYVLSATSFWVFGLGFYAVKQTSIFQDVTYDAGPQVKQKPQNESASEYKKNRLEKFEKENFRDQLHNHLRTKQSFLRNRLTIDELAEELGVTPHDLSLFINEKLDQNFFDLINRYRVEEFKKRLSDPTNKNYTLLGIAMDSGFNSKASLNRIFKKHTGISPTEYLRRLPH